MLLLRRGSDLPVAQYCSMPRLPTSNFTFLVTKKVCCKGNKNKGVAASWILPFSKYHARKNRKKKLRRKWQGIADSKLIDSTTVLTTTQNSQRTDSPEFSCLALTLT